MNKRTIIVAGVIAAVVATAVAVPAVAASRDEPTPPQARASVAGQRYVVDTANLRKLFEARIDAAVADGWITPKVAKTLRERVATGDRLLRTQTRGIEAYLLAQAAKALGTTPKQLRAELRSGKTPAEILKAHGKTPNALVQQLVERLDQQLGGAVGKGRLSEQRVDGILERVQQRLGAWLERLLAQG